LSITGVLGFALLYVGAEQIARLTGSLQTKEAIQSVSIALLFVPIMSSLRGYFQGKQDMVPTAVSQVAEQTIRVTVMTALLLIFTSQGRTDASIAAGATLGSAAGGMAGLLVMLGYWIRERRQT